MKWTDATGHSFTLRDACYVGNVEAVRALLEMGADPDMTDPDDDGWEWISAAGKTPTPLHCVAIAWTHVPEHLEIIRLLIERGAVVADTVLQDYWIETTLTDAAIEVGRAFGIDGEHLRNLRAQHGAVEDRYDGGKVLFVEDE
jgi:ankyrin repeat protein